VPEQTKGRAFILEARKILRDLANCALADA
jgi:hypothetical protein